MPFAGTLKFLAQINDKEILEKLGIFLFVTLVCANDSKADNLIL